MVPCPMAHCEHHRNCGMYTNPAFWWREHNGFLSSGAFCGFGPLFSEGYGMIPIVLSISCPMLIANYCCVNRELQVVWNHWVHTCMEVTHITVHDSAIYICWHIYIGYCSHHFGVFRSDSSAYLCQLILLVPCWTLRYTRGHRKCTKHDPNCRTTQITERSVTVQERPHALKVSGLWYRQHGSFVYFLSSDQYNSHTAASKCFRNPWNIEKQKRSALPCYVWVNGPEDRHHSWRAAEYMKSCQTNWYKESWQLQGKCSRYSTM